MSMLTNLYLPKDTFWSSVHQRQVFFLLYDVGLTRLTLWCYNLIQITDSASAIDVHWIATFSDLYSQQRADVLES